MTRTIFDFDINERKTPTLFNSKGFNFLIGTDEAGRGPAAGALYTAAVCFKNYDNLYEILPKLNDSKKLSEKTREDLFPIIKENSIWSVRKIEIETIEKINILNASLYGMGLCAKDVIQQLKTDNVLILVDGNKGLKENFQNKPVIKGDSKSAAIAAASILAKVSRDNYMYELDKKYPEYNFKNNKGYLTKDHINSIKKFGIKEIHRKTFLKNYI